MSDYMAGAGAGVGAGTSPGGGLVVPDYRPPSRTGGEYVPMAGDLMVKISRDELMKVTFTLAKDSDHIIANITRPWPLRGVSRVNDVLVAISGKAVVPKMHTKVLAYLNERRTRRAYELVFRLPVVQLGRSSHSNQTRAEAGTLKVEGYLRKLSRPGFFRKPRWHEGRYFVLDPVAKVLRRFKTRPDPKAKSVDLELSTVLEVIETKVQPPTTREPIRFSLTLTNGQQRLFEASTTEDCRVWVSTIASLIKTNILTDEPLDRIPELARTADEPRVPVPADHIVVATAAAAQAAAALGVSGTPVRAESSVFSPTSNSSASMTAAPAPAPAPAPASAAASTVTSPPALPRTAAAPSSSITRPSASTSTSTPVASPRAPPPPPVRTAAGTPRSRAAAAAAAAAAARVTSPASSTGSRRKGSKSPGRRSPGSRRRGGGKGSKSPGPRASRTPPPTAAAAAAPAPHGSGMVGDAPQLVPVSDALHSDSQARVQEILNRQREQATDEFDLVYERLQVLMLPPKDTTKRRGRRGGPAGPAPPAENPRLGLSLSDTPDGRIFVAAVLPPPPEPSTTRGRSRSRSRPGSRASSRGRSTSPHSVDGASVFSCTSYEELRHLTRQMKALAGTPADAPGSSSRNDAASRARSPGAMSIDTEDGEPELLVFDEAHLPLVTAEGLDPETGEPVTAPADGTGLRPGDVLMALDSLPVKRTDSLASIAQRLLRRTMSRGTWVTVARPIGRIARVHHEEYPPPAATGAAPPTITYGGAPGVGDEHFTSAAPAPAPAPASSSSYLSPASAGHSSSSSSSAAAAAAPFGDYSFESSSARDATPAAALPTAADARRPDSPELAGVPSLPVPSRRAMPVSDLPWAPPSNASGSGGSGGSGGDDGGVIASEIESKSREVNASEAMAESKLKEGDGDIVSPALSSASSAQRPRVSPAVVRPDFRGVRTEPPVPSRSSRVNKSRVEIGADDAQWFRPETEEEGEAADGALVVEGHALGSSADVGTGGAGASDADVSGDVRSPVIRGGGDVVTVPNMRWMGVEEVVEESSPIH